jgi:cold shock protein
VVIHAGDICVAAILAGTLGLAAATEEMPFRQEGGILKEQVVDPAASARIMSQGQVKWFDPKKGYGFIASAGGDDVFVHFTVIEGSGFRGLRCGESVEYLPQAGPKGLFAQRVRRIAAAT